MLNDHDLNRPSVVPEGSRWTAPAGSLARDADYPAIAVAGQDAARPVIPGLTVWDIWPVQLDDGALAPVGEGDLWIALCAPRSDDPDERHNLARMRLLFRRDGAWLDCGNLLPNGFSPGSREWSGSTRLDPASGKVTLWFTAAGRRGETSTDFEQRLFQASGKLVLDGPLPAVTAWSDLFESAVNDGRHYADVRVVQGVAGQIKGFRDPYWFRDPLDGQGYLLFTGSKPPAAARSTYDGVIGIARASDADGEAPFELLPALIDADGMVNELERPHVFVHDGLYYLFWSSQAHLFAPGSLNGPTGLYGMVAPSLFGPWQPLNSSGLVLANPPSEPRQTYAWQVLPDTLEVVSFLDFWGLEGRDPAQDPALKAAQFGGTIAPMARIALYGNVSRIVEGGA